VHDLFSEEEDVDLANATSAAPLATRMRPRTRGHSGLSDDVKNGRCAAVNAY